MTNKKEPQAQTSFRGFKPPILKNGNFSHAPILRVIIEKRRTIRDTVGVEGVFIMEGKGLAKVSTSTSINGNPDSATISLAMSTQVYYQPYDKNHNVRLAIPNRDLTSTETTLRTVTQTVQEVLPDGRIVEVKKYKEVQVNLDDSKILDEKTLRPINDYAEELEAGDLIYIDAWSWRKSKMLPVFTGTIVKKRVTESLQDTRYLELDCEDLLYFLRYSHYITAPSVFGEAFTQAINGTSNESKELEVTPFNTNLMGLSGFETFLKILLSDGSSENIEDYLDSNGRVLTPFTDKSKDGKRKTSLDIFPCRAPILSRVERILAFPYTISMGQKWQLTQSENKSRLDQLLDVARSLEVEFFLSECGEPVFKYPTRLDGFAVPGLPPVNLLARNNLGRSRTDSTEGRLIDQYIDLVAKQSTVAGRIGLGVIKDATKFKFSSRDKRDDSDYTYVDSNSNYQTLSTLKNELSKGGEIPTIYEDELQGSSFEENTEKVVTAGIVKIDQNFVQNNLSNDQAILTSDGQGKYFRDVVNSLKYGIRFEEFHPLWLRDPHFVDLYIWMKLAVINQERFRGSIQVHDDPFIRKGHSVKVHKLRQIKVLRLLPKEPTDVVFFNKKNPTKGEQEVPSQNATLLISNLNVPARKSGLTSSKAIEEDIEFEEVLINAPCVYYAEGISRSYTYGEGSPSMTLELTAGRAEFNTKREGSGHYGEAEDQWTRGFYTFWEFFYQPPELSNHRSKDVNLQPTNQTGTSPTHQAPARNTPAPTTPATTNNGRVTQTGSSNILPVQAKLNSMADKIKADYGSKTPSQHIQGASKNPVFSSIARISLSEGNKDTGVGRAGTNFTGNSDESILTRIDLFVQEPEFWKIVNTHVSNTKMTFTMDSMFTSLLSHFKIDVTKAKTETAQAQYGAKQLIVILFQDAVKKEDFSRFSIDIAASVKVLKDRLTLWSKLIASDYNTFFGAQ